ncbi:conserved hypothetical protein [Crenothrix polyspora]|uniref:HEAT repeat domain-containing protein n=1 Tax=Crenothrix polyspora TaxID=360316 RepID=A0A1R4GZY5_9GAMM|nr:HEAT repeat domain-containing protein [Crenothrix polyspora]SJM89516.1 conserved hypothetical protein [Crenothrix polyspora]
MINPKYLPALIVTLLILGALVFAANRWGLPLVQTMTNSAKNIPAKPLVNAKQAVPEEFIEFDSQAGQDNDGRFATLTTQAVWQNLLAGFQRGEKAQIGLENALIMRLRKEPGNAVYEELLSYFKPGILDTPAQQVLVSILGEVGNYNAAEILMRLVSGGLLHDPDVKLSAFHAISKFAPESWREHSNAELAPVFEAAWQTGDTEFLSSIANVMASIGTPSTLDIFIQTLTDNNNDERVEIVNQAMTNLVNPALIPKLDDLLQSSPLDNVQLASGEALANMGEIEAATAIFKWSTQVDAGRIDLVKDLFEKAMNTTPEFIDYLDTTLPTQSFASTEIKQAIDEVLVNVKNGVE